MSDLREDAAPRADTTDDRSSDGTDGRRLAALPLAAAAIAIVLVAGALAYAVTHRTGAAAMPLACRPIACGDVSGRAAPDFHLTNEDGRPFSLSGERGRVVVLEFMDPVCKDICPIVSSEFVLADRLLGADAHRVAFVAVNVNQYHDAPAALRTFSEHHRLSTLPNWSFVTGPTPALKRVWQEYGVTVIPNPTGDVMHTSTLYFIDPSGQMRYVAFPVRSKASIETWARSIAAVSRSLIG